MQQKLIEINFENFKKKNYIEEFLVYFKNKPQHKISHIALERAYVNPKLWNVFTNDFWSIRDFERVYSPLKHQKFISQFNKPDTSWQFMPLVQGNFFLLGGENNYWHYLCDFIPRLLCLTNIEEKIKIIIPSNLPEKYILFTEQIINELNIKNITFYKINENYIFQFEKIFISKRPNINFTYIFYDSLLGKYFPKKPVNNLFIIRGKVTRRRAINEKEISENLKRYNYKTIDCAILTIQEQVSIFSQAKNIIILSGASLINLLFVPKGIKVIEIRSNNDGKFSLMVQMQKRFDLILLNSSKKIGSALRKDIIIDYQDLEKNILREKMI